MQVPPLCHGQGHSSGLISSHPVVIQSLLSTCCHHIPSHFTPRTVLEGRYKFREEMEAPDQSHTSRKAVFRLRAVDSKATLLLTYTKFQQAACTVPLAEVPHGCDRHLLHLPTLPPTFPRAPVTLRSSASGFLEHRPKWTHSGVLRSSH